MMKNYDHWLPQVEQAIKKMYDTDNDQFGLIMPMDYIITIGGKRIRPILALMAYELFQEGADKIIEKAVVIEAFHNFTLMHDDIMDKAPVRRGKDTVHVKWNTPTAILSGDAMLVDCYQRLAHEDKKVVSRFSETAIEVCEGQMADMSFEEREAVELSEYLEMIRLKTAVLIGYSMEFGAMLAQTSEENISRCYECGEKMGLSFQIMDDLLDCFGSENLVGKQKGGDILADKKTYLSIWAKTKDKAAYESILQEDSNRIKVDKMMQLFIDTGAKEAAEKQMEAYYQSAIEALNGIEAKDDSSKVMLQDLFNRLFKRSH